MTGGSQRLQDDSGTCSALPKLVVGAGKREFLSCVHRGVGSKCDGADLRSASYGMGGVAEDEPLNYEGPLAMVGQAYVQPNARFRTKGLLLEELI